MRLTLILVLLYASVPSFADEKAKGPLAEARLRWLKGNYAEARELYEAKLKDETLRAAAAIGVAKTFISEGEYDKANVALDARLKTDPDHLDLKATKADLLFQLGKWDEALKLAEDVIKAKDDHFLARWVRARIIRDQGDMKAADQEMRWFVRTYTKRDNADMPIKDPDELLIVAEAGTENARWYSLSDQFEFILNEVFPDILKFEPECWMAEYQAGAMLLEKLNLPEAIKAFNKALKLNPHAADVFVGKGQAALITYELKDAELYVEQALKIKPRLPSALRLRADIHTMTGEIAKAYKVLSEAEEINPRDEQTLARLAASAYLLNQKEEFERIVGEVKKFNPKPGVFFHDLAAALDERKFYTQSEKYFKLALEMNDKLAAPKNALGLLYMRLGKETAAKDLLDKAFTFDPYNVRVANSRKVLKHLTTYETKESAHYILRFDAKTDRILAEFVLDFLEEVHARLIKDFNYEPEGKILIEVFNNHEMFSGRTVALPDLHTIGACTGRVVTMCSPDAKGLLKKFNWGRVIRHELVHVFNLAQTDFQVPHWLTEGLAVRNEGGGRPPAWNAYLRERHGKNDLFNLDNILMGFVKPKSQDEWSLAYYQSLLYVEYLIATHGIESVGKILDAFRAGMTNDAAIKKACGVSKADFEKGYREYLTAIVKGIPAPVKKPKDAMMTLAELEKANEKDPANVDIAAQLAAEYLRRMRPADATKLADGVLEKDKGHAIAAIVKAKLLIADKNNDAARKVIQSAVETNPKDARLRAYLGKLHLDAKELADAAVQFEQCRQLDPLEEAWLIELRDLYVKLNDSDKLVSVLREIISRDPDDFKSRLILARRLFDDKKYPEAEATARDALMIDVNDKEARKVLLESLQEQKKDAEAEKIAKRYQEQ